MPLLTENSSTTAASRLVAPIPLLSSSKSPSSPLAASPKTNRRKFLSAYEKFLISLQKPITFSDFSRIFLGISSQISTQNFTEIPRMFSEVEVLVPLVEHVHPLGVVHPFPHQQLLPLQAAVNPVKHRAEYYQHAQQSKLRDGVIVDQAGHENAQGYPRLGGYNRSGGVTS